MSRSVFPAKCFAASDLKVTADATERDSETLGNFLCHLTFSEMLDKLQCRTQQ